jgi:hypothetical protein
MYYITGKKATELWAFAPEPLCLKKSSSPHFFVEETAFLGVLRMMKGEKQLFRVLPLLSIHHK